MTGVSISVLSKPPNPDFLENIKCSDALKDAPRLVIYTLARTRFYLYLFNSEVWEGAVTYLRPLDAAMSCEGREVA